MNAYNEEQFDIDNPEAYPVFQQKSVLVVILAK